MISVGICCRNQVMHFWVQPLSCVQERGTERSRTCRNLLSFLWEEAFRSNVHSARRAGRMCMVHSTPAGNGSSASFTDRTSACSSDACSQHDVGINGETPVGGDDH